MKLAVGSKHLQMYNEAGVDMVRYREYAYEGTLTRWVNVHLKPMGPKSTGTRPLNGAEEDLEVKSLIFYAVLSLRSHAHLAVRCIFSLNFLITYVCALTHSFGNHEIWNTISL